MSTRGFSVSALVPAPPRDVYAILADYRDGHPHILPRPPFISLIVERGGTGAGTVIRVGMRVLTRVQTFRAVVTEPEPGRVLAETTDTGYVTTFTVEPEEDGTRSRVTIATEIVEPSGLAATMESWLAARLLRPVYREELGLLAEVAAVRGASDTELPE